MCFQRGRVYCHIFLKFVRGRVYCYIFLESVRGRDYWERGRFFYHRGRLLQITEARGIKFKREELSIRESLVFKFHHAMTCCVAINSKEGDYWIQLSNCVLSLMLHKWHTSYLSASIELSWFTRWFSVYTELSWFARWFSVSTKHS